MCQEQEEGNSETGNDGSRNTKDDDLKNKKRRSRTAFTEWQLASLEQKFSEQQYMVGDERIALAQSLRLNPSQVKIWFQNRRIRWRREHFARLQLSATVLATTSTSTTLTLTETIDEGISASQSQK